MIETQSPTLIKSILQRSLLKGWERLTGGGPAAPLQCLGTDPDLRSFLGDCVVYEAPTLPDTDFRLFYQGANTIPFYGSKLKRSVLSEHVAPTFREAVLESYRAVVRTGRPFFSVRTTLDRAQRPLTVETLRLPFCAFKAKGVTHVLTHFHAISVEGHFAATNLHEDRGHCRYKVQALLDRTPVGGPPRPRP